MFRNIYPILIRKNRFKNAFTCLLLILILLCSCREDRRNKRKQMESIYQIVSHLLNKERVTNIPSPLGFPPVPGGKQEYKYTAKDSLRSYEYYFKESTRKKIIAFYPEIKISITNQDSLEVFENGKFKEGVEDLFFKKTLPIKLEVHKIRSLKNDSLILYTDNHKKELGSGFLKIDRVMIFSKIVFNKSFTKAVLDLGVVFDKLNGVTSLLYLEKEYGVWVIKKEKVLTIS